MESEQKKDPNWMQNLWRPAMGWMYMVICMLDMAIFPVAQALPEPEQEILPEIQEPQEADREMKRKHVDHGHIPFASVCAS